ncbi:MAG: hypothetical protein ACN6O5_10095, partial [Achromobacter sp.]|uniref:hypothetical protein n=1 Tax=Achromobacter sp. TaxID=134375 RepID=UPI003D07DD74
FRVFRVRGAGREQGTGREQGRKRAGNESHEVSDCRVLLAAISYLSLTYHWYLSVISVKTV